MPGFGSNAVLGVSRTEFVRDGSNFMVQIAVCK